MITVKLYKNNYHYPKYSHSLEEVGETLQCTPININSTSGEILTQNFSELHNANYISLNIDNNLFYAWIDSIDHYSGDKRYKIKYTVDAFRTYINKVDLGVQFVKRSPVESDKLDALIGSDSQKKIVTIAQNSFLNSDQRTLVVLTSTATDYAQAPLPNSPSQPSPYYINFIDYTLNAWSSTPEIVSLFEKITGGSKPINLVAIYSIPKPQIVTGITKVPSKIVLDFQDTKQEVTGDVYTFTGNYANTLRQIRTIPTPPESLKRVPHTVQLVIPDAGVLTIPDEFLYDSRLRLMMNIDLYSGATNYSLVISEDELYKLTPYSIRGSALSTIPIAYDAESQLMAVNQTSRNNTLLGDVAGLVMGGAQVIGGLALTQATGGISVTGAVSGIAQAGNSIQSLITHDSALKDSLHQHQNAPAYLGSALNPLYNGRYYIVTTKVDNDNSVLVNSLYGYPQNKLMTLTLPTSKGFIQTQECNVSGAIPKWALEEINNRFNQGISVQ